MKAWARLGDTGSHSGSNIGAITGSAAKTKCEDKLVARVGDAYTCPAHGAQTIVGPGSTTYLVEDHPLARNGDATSCGAVLIATAVKTFDT